MLCCAVRCEEEGGGRRGFTTGQDGLSGLYMPTVSNYQNHLASEN